MNTKDKKLCFKVSSSIANFHDKIAQKFKLPEWHWWNDINNHVIFFGMYHIGDYARLIWHRGKRTIFWCGSDIRSLQKPWYRILVKMIPANHICENDFEDEKISSFGLKTTIKPQFFGNIDDFPISFYPSKNPTVWLTYHKGRELEYGFDLLPYLIKNCPGVKIKAAYDGQFPESVFNEIVKNYHAHIRLNTFDGFGDSLAKSVLMGQYPISRIWYPHIANFEYPWELVDHINQLKEKTKPNYKAAEFWRKKLSEPLLS